MSDILLYLGVSGILKYAVYYYWRDRIPKDAILTGHVTRLTVYPVKSMREVELLALDCTSDTGPHRGSIIDRQWIVVAGDNTLVTIRQEPNMNKIQPEYDGYTLRLSSPGYDDVTVDVDSVIKTGTVVKTRVEGSVVTGLDCGDAVSKWLSHFFGKEGYKLLYAGSEITRRNFKLGNKDYNHWTKHAKSEDMLFYQDVSPFHLLSEQSALDLGKRLGNPIDVMQFRPNIVVTANMGPYDEDTWKELFIGKVRFTTIKLCDRCTLPNVDRTTCVRNKDNEPLKTLKRYRSFVPGLGPMFGTDLVVEREGTIEIGDPVYAIKGDVVNLPKKYT